MTRWLGRWRLVPELCHYEIGTPPRDAVYVISQGAGKLEFTLNWLDGEGREHSVSYAAPPNGCQVASDAPEAETLSVKAESDAVLTSEALKDGWRIGHAIRRINEAGDLMSILHLRERPGEATARVFQVYRREDAHD